MSDRRTMLRARLTHLPVPLIDANPHRWFNQMRETAPVLWHEPTSTWYVTRHDDVAALLTDRRLGAKRDYLETLVTPEVWDRLAPLREFVHRWLIFSDPPRHTVLRKALWPLYEPARTQMTANAIALGFEACDEPGSGACLHNARRAIIGGMGSMLGLEPEAFTDLISWSRKILAAATIDEYDQEVVDEGTRAHEALTAFVERACRHRSGHLASTLADAMDRGDLDLSDAVGAFSQVNSGTLEPTMTVIAYGLQRIAADPSLIELLRADPEAFTWELTRLGAPFHVTPRYSLDEVRLEEATIPAGRHVGLVLLSANRDPRKFPEPERFRLDRDPALQLSFGRGRHACMGATVARTLVAETLTAICGGDREHLCPPKANSWRLRGDIRRWSPLV